MSLTNPSHFHAGTSTSSQAASDITSEYARLRSSVGTTPLPDIALATQGLPRHTGDSSGIETTRSASYQRLASEEAQFASYPNTTDSTPNIIVFGETGVGKSSLINMISGTESASVSGGILGCTFKATPYEVELSGQKYRLWDTAGLNEGEKGKVPADRAMESLHELVHILKDGGVSLLVYCIRGLRFRDIVKINYDLFHKVVCGGHVPIVIVVTGLENEENMEEWWIDNVEDFYHRGMHFSGHACVATRRGKVTKNGQHMFEEEYNRSVKLVRELIAAYCPERPWKPDSSRWLGNIAEKMRQMYAEDDNRVKDYVHNVHSRDHSMTSRQQCAIAHGAIARLWKQFIPALCDRIYGPRK